MAIARCQGARGLVLPSGPIGKHHGAFSHSARRRRILGFIRLKHHGQFVSRCHSLEKERNAVWQSGILLFRDGDPTRRARSRDPSGCDASDERFLYAAVFAAQDKRRRPRRGRVSLNALHLTWRSNDSARGRSGGRFTYTAIAPGTNYRRNACRGPRRGMAYGLTRNAPDAFAPYSTLAVS